MKRQYIKPEHAIDEVALQNPLLTTSLAVKEGKEDDDAGVREEGPAPYDHWHTEW